MNKVLLLEHEFDKADFRLHRLIEWAGGRMDQFDRRDASGDWLLASKTWPVTLALGPRATEAVGLHGGLLNIRGYIHSTSRGYVIPTVSPAFIQRGNAKLSAAFINDVQKAFALNRDGYPPQFTDYLLDPLPSGALAWARSFVEFAQSHPATYLAFDIETPGKGDDEEDLELDDDGKDRTWRIERIGFSYRGLSALSIPFSPEYLPAIRLVLGFHGPKVVWNAGFDVPRLRRAGVEINGLIHDGMVAWHVLHSDLPKSLKFVATFTCPWQPAWKHLSGSRPAFYNATDADVEYRSMVNIESELRRADLWHVYERDVLELEPILIHMQQVGMPLDQTVRVDRAMKLAEKLATIKAEMTAQIPLEARKVEHVYKSIPADTTGLLSRPGIRSVPVCDHCGAVKPPKSHFKRFVKKQNPCADRQVVFTEVIVDEYFRLAEFSPSRDQLLRYHLHLNRPVPMVYDKKLRKKKPSFAEKEIKGLMLKYPKDPLYGLILQYRQLDKLAGTYVGRPLDDN